MSVHTKPARQYKKQQAIFAKCAAFNGLIDEGGEFAKSGRQAKKAMHQHWEKRDMRAGKMYNSKNAKPSAVSITKH